MLGKIQKLESIIEPSSEYPILKIIHCHGIGSESGLPSKTLDLKDYQITKIIQPRFVILSKLS